MKSNFVKYIFFIFVITIMGFAVYKVNQQESQKKEDTTTADVEIQEEPVKELTLGIAEYDTINPILSNNKYVQEVSRLIYEPLLEIDSEYKIKNNLVKEWAKTSDTTYLLKLEENIKWSDGQQFSADDVIYTIDVLKKNPSIYAYNVQYIVKADKIDSNTVQITIDHEILFFEYNLIFPIMSKTYYDGVDFATTDKNSMPIGTGKYKITQNNGEEIILSKNENYNREETTLETINIGKYANMGELYNAFKLGKVDLITTNNIKIEDYIGNIGYNKKEVAGRDFDFLAINTQSNILSYKEVRKAIVYTINKENIVGTQFNGKYKVTNYPLDYGSYLRGEDQGNICNPDRARQVLEENGWNYKKKKWQKTENYNTKVINLKLVVQASNSTRLNIAEMIKSNLEEVGMKVSIVKASDSQYQYYLQNKNYDMIITGITQSASPSLETFFGTDNLANYNNDEMSTLMNEIKNITKEDLLKEKYAKIRQIYNDDVPYIGLYSSYYAIVSNWNLKGNITANWYNIFMDINNWYKN